MTAGAPDTSTPDIRRFGGYLLLGIGLFFFIGFGALTLIDEWNWGGAVTVPCVVIASNPESHSVTCEARPEGRPPLQWSLRGWRPMSVGLTINIEYMPREPTRFRHVDVQVGRWSRPSNYYHLRGASRIALGGILLAMGAVLLFYGSRLLRRPASRAGEP